MTKSLYLKYRPQTFNDVYGQEIIKKILINSLKDNKLNHAYLFYGIRGTGKTTLARLFAKAINCEKHSDGQICNECNSCKEITNSSSLNVIEIDAATHNSVEDIRDLVEKASYLTQQGKYKIYIIDEVHMLSKSAFNALLKTLEEPPSHTIFLLATTEINKIPETILSRTIILNLENLSNKEIIANLEAILKSENIKYDAKALEYVADASQGSMRDAISLLTNITLYGDTITVANTVNVLGVVERNVIDSILLGKQSEKVLFENKHLNIRRILYLLISEVTYLIENNIASPIYELNRLLASLLNLATFTKDETVYSSILPSLFIESKTFNTNNINNVSYETIKEIKEEKVKIEEKLIENVEKEVEIRKSVDMEEKSIKNNKEEDKHQVTNNVEKDLSKSSSITDYASIDYYKELLFTIDNKQLHDYKTKWEDTANFVAVENKYSKYAIILSNAKLLAASKLGLIIGFEDKLAVEEYKKISVDPELFEFVKIILGKEEPMLPVHPENWKKLIKSVNSSYVMKNVKRIDTTQFARNSEKEIFDIEKDLFGDKLID